MLLCLWCFVCFDGGAGDGGGGDGGAGDGDVGVGVVEVVEAVELREAWRLW